MVQRFINVTRKYKFLHVKKISGHYQRTNYKENIISSVLRNVCLFVTFKFYVHECFGCIYVYMCAWCPWRPEEGIGSLNWSSCELLCGCP